MNLHIAANRTLVTTPVAGIDPLCSADEPIFGEWLAISLDGLDSSDPGSVSPSFDKWLFSPEGEGVRLQQFERDGDGFAKSPAVECFSTLDGRPWADPYGPFSTGQLVQSWRISSGLLVRLILENVAPPERLEWQAFAVSSNRSRLVVSSWHPDTPERRGYLIFERGATGSPAGATVGSVSKPDISASLIPSSEPIVGEWHLEASHVSSGRSPDSSPGAPIMRCDFGADHFELAQDLYVRPDSDRPRLALRGRFDGRFSNAGDDHRTAFWRVDPSLIVQCVQNLDADEEWAIHCVSRDRRRLVTASWVAPDPDRQILRVFNRQASRGDRR